MDPSRFHSLWGYIQSLFFASISAHSAFVAWDGRHSIESCQKMQLSVITDIPLYFKHWIRPVSWSGASASKCFLPGCLEALFYDLNLYSHSTRPIAKSNICPNPCLVCLRYSRLPLSSIGVSPATISLGLISNISFWPNKLNTFTPNALPSYKAYLSDTVLFHLLNHIS